MMGSDTMPPKSMAELQARGRALRPLPGGTVEARDWQLGDGGRESFSPLGENRPTHLCAECMEFGTLCRPCRAERYDAARAREAAARRQITRARLRPVWWLVGTLAACFALQDVADRHCAPGRWDAGEWRCEVRR